ncbi:MAG: CARDB domain-containing protein [bacterium]
MIGMPLDKLRLTNAEETCGIVPYLYEFSMWDAPSQSYITHRCDQPTYNFPVSPAMAYFTTMMQPWALESLSLKSSSLSSSLSSSSAGASSIPQVELGHVYNADLSVPAGGQIHFTAYITGRESDILTETSPGCTYESGYWVVNIGNFAYPWDADEVLHIDFTNIANGQTGALDILLAYNGQTTDITLSAPPAADLFVKSITMTPANPEPDQSVTVTVVIKNNGPADVTGPFMVDFYQDLAGNPVPPAAGQQGEIRWSLGYLAAGTTSTFTETIFYSQIGTYEPYVQVDTDQQTPDTDRTNNILAYSPDCFRVGVCEGDFNYDGSVMLNDFAIFKASMGMCTGNPDYNPVCDFDQNGCVDLADFVIFKADMGRQNCPRCQ